jgi:hypothetical protein
MQRSCRIKDHAVSSGNLFIICYIGWFCIVFMSLPHIRCLEYFITSSSFINGWRRSHGLEKRRPISPSPWTNSDFPTEIVYWSRFTLCNLYYFIPRFSILIFLLLMLVQPWSKGIDARDHWEKKLMPWIQMNILMWLLLCWGHRQRYIILSLGFQASEYFFFTNVCPFVPEYVSMESVENASTESVEI